MSSRPRPSSSLPKAPTNLDATCVISDAAVLTGIYPITVGANAVLHPRARVLSNYGAVVIGPGCIVCERAVIGLQQEPAEEGDAESSGTVELQANVSVEPAATVEAAMVGEGSLLEAGCRIGAGAIIGANCRVTPLCSVAAAAQLPDFTVVHGDNRTRKERPGPESYRAAAREKELEVLKKLIPSNLAKWQTA